jgi:hypothetical protein
MHVLKLNDLIAIGHGVQFRVLLQCRPNDLGKDRVERQTVGLEADLELLSRFSRCPHRLGVDLSGQLH